MDNELAKYYISIEAQVSDLNAKFATIKDSLSTISTAQKDVASSATESANKIESSWAKTTSAFLSSQLIVEALNKIKSAIVEGIKAADDDLTMMVRLRLELGDGAEAIEKYATAQSLSTRFAKDDILSAANTLTIHKLNREEIEKLLPVIQDFATKSGRSATETASAFGRAIEYGSTRGLRPFGIEVDKNGSQLEIFNELMDAGNGKVKGLANQLGDTGLGGMIEFQHAIQEAGEDVGKQLLPSLHGFTDWLKGDGVKATHDFADVFLSTWHGIIEMVKTAATFQATTANYGIIDSWKFADTMAAIDDAKFERNKEEINNILTINQQKLNGLKLDQEIAVMEGKSYEGIAKKVQYYQQIVDAAKQAQGEMSKTETQEDKNAWRGITLDKRTSSTSKLGTTPINPGKVDKTEEEFWGKQHEVITSNLEVYKKKQEEALQELNDSLKNSETTIDQWYKEGVQNIKETGTQEVKVYEEIKRTSHDDGEAKKAQNEIDKSVIETKKKLLDLDEKKIDALNKQAIEKAKLNELIDKTSEEAGLSNGVGNQDPLANLRSKQQQELNAVKDQNAKRLLEAKNLHATETQLSKLAADQETIIAKKQAADDKLLQEAKINLAAETAGNLANIFQGLYEVTGSKSEAMFDMMKAMQIAQTLINTYSSATAAYNSLVGIPIAGPAMATVAAASAIALGLANVKKIVNTKMTKMEKGGMISGNSHAAGGVHLEVEGGEYFVQRAATSRYGSQALDAVNAGLATISYNSGVSSKIAGSRAADGGLVVNSAKRGGASPTIHITNLQDPRMIDRHLATTDGKNSVVNFLGQNKMAVRRALGV